MGIGGRRLENRGSLGRQLGDHRRQQSAGTQWEPDQSRPGAIGPNCEIRLRLPYQLAPQVSQNGESTQAEEAATPAVVSVSIQLDMGVRRGLM